MTDTKAGESGTMKCVRWVRTGLEAEAEVDDVAPIPEPGPHQVLLRVTATAGNPVDFKLQRGDFGVEPGGILGHDAAGVVLKLGEGVTQFAVGDRVAVFVEGVGRLCSNGSYAQYLVAHEYLTAKIPAALSDEQGAAVPLAGLTAYECVVVHAKVKAGQTVLVAGASGGVGAIVTELCRHFVGPTGRVVVTAGNDESATFVAEHLKIPASRIIRYSGKSVAELVDAAVAANDGQLFDVTFDMFGRDMKRLCLQATGFGGHMVTIVEEPKGFEADALNLWDARRSKAYIRSMTLTFEFLGGRALFAPDSELIAYRNELDGLFALIEKGAIAPPAVQVLGDLSAENVSKMHNVFATTGARGKLVLRVPHA